MPFNKTRALQEAEKTLAQGKIVEAAQKYLDIAENDPSDLAIINIAGDLCVRANNMPEALRLFRRLAESYAREGYIPRAIAIYKKVLKLDSSNVDAMLRLAELYSSQALSREARDLYAQALAICQNRNLQTKALEVMRKISADEPANIAHRLRLAELYKAAGQLDEAFKTHLEAAEVALAHSDDEGVTAALEQAASLRPDDPRIREFHQRRSAASPQMQAPPPTEVAQPLPNPVEHFDPVDLGNHRTAESEPEPAAVAEPEFAAVPPEGPETSGYRGESPEPSGYRGESEVDLSEEWEAAATHAPPSAAAFSLDDLLVEIDFYLDYGMAQKAFERLEQIEQQFPLSTYLSELRRHVEERQAVQTRAEGIAREGAGKPLRALPSGLESSRPPHSQLAIQEPHKPYAGKTALALSGTTAARPDFASSLGAVLSQMGKEASPAPSESDPQKHYELGVAFREMGLLDEAIGELQKAVRRSRPGPDRERFLSSCRVLALCFLDKNMPALAAKWYTRALKVPDLDPDVLLALQYDLGVAYELAGNLDAAKENFLEVYGQNIEYRDVAAKVRQLAANQ